MSNFRSHMRDEIQAALNAGQEAWMLDTGTDGEDDHLIGSREEVEADLKSFYDLDELPVNWTLEKVTWNVLDAAQAARVE